MGVLFKVGGVKFGGGGISRCSFLVVFSEDDNSLTLDLDDIEA